MENTFFIKPGYAARQKVKQLADRFVESKPIVHQPDVYPLAAFLAARLGCDTIVDVGCGGGGKLADLHPRFRIVGVDMAQNIEFCRASYAFGTWIEWDLERPEPIPVEPDVLRRAVIVCSDVIEHLVDPTHLLRNLRAMLRSAALCVLSTPERDLTRGPDDLGPPANKYHVREWNLFELDRLLRAHELAPAFVGLTRTDDHRNERKTTVALIEGASERRAAGSANGSAPSDSPVAVISPNRGEPGTLQAAEWLAAMGVGLHFLDLWTTDCEEMQLRAKLGDALLNFERFPTEPGERAPSDAEITARMVELASALPHDVVVFGR